MRTRVRALCVDYHDGMRAALMQSKRLESHSGVELEWDGAADVRTGLALLKKNQPHIVLAEMSLSDDPANRDGLYVAYAAYQQGAHVFVLTAHKLEDTLQSELYALGVPVFTKPFEPALLLRSILSAAIAPKHARMRASTYSLSPIASLLREVDGNVAELAKQLVAVCVADALAETKGNKSRAARLLQVDRGFIDRALAYLPRKTV